MTKTRQKGGEGLEACQLPATCTKAWDIQPGEPLLWYARFEMYRALGPHRTLSAAYNIYRESRGLPHKFVHPNWSSTAETWKWRERAVASDVAERDRLQAEDQEIHRKLREKRLGMLDEMLTAAFDTLQQANLAGMSQDEARGNLPTLRALFRDMVTLQGREIDRPNASEQVQGMVPFTYSGDDYRRAQLELYAWRGGQDVEIDPAAYPETKEPAAWHAGKQTLLVCVGADAALTIDLAALRAVKSATGLDFHRIVNVKRDSFDAYLRRERSKGRPVELLHLSVHAAHEGVAFADGVVDGDWLSERLLGVRVMLLAGCEGDAVGDWLGVVPYVVTLAEEITHEDAATLTQHFWSGIGRGMGADEALDKALAHCAPVVSEYVVRHW